MADVRKDFFSHNGFDENGNTFIALGETYKHKDVLKTSGYKFNKLLNWHGASKVNIDGITLIPIAFDDIYEVINSKWIQEKYDAHEVIKGIKNNNVVSSSNYIGSPGEKFGALSATVKDIIAFNGKYGSCFVYTFEDMFGNALNWFTSKDCDIDVNDNVLISGIVKKHDVFNGVKTTYITRCKIGVVM